MNEIDFDVLLKERQDLRSQKARVDILTEDAEKKRDALIQEMLLLGTSPETIDTDIERHLQEEQDYQEQKKKELQEWKKAIDEVNRIYEENVL